MRKFLMLIIMAGLAVALFNKFASAEDQQALSDSPIFQSVKGFFDQAKSAIEPADSVESERSAKPEQPVKRLASKKNGGKPGIICIGAEGDMQCN